MTNETLKGIAIAAAIAAALSPATAFAKKGANGKMIECQASNDCKGKGACKSAKNDCKGQNGCKGQGFTHEKSAKACEAKGGTVMAKK